jgi:hypothetical protein
MNNCANVTMHLILTQKRRIKSVRLTQGFLR